MLKLEEELLKKHNATNLYDLSIYELAYELRRIADITEPLRKQIKKYAKANVPTLEAELQKQLKMWDEYNEKVTDAFNDLCEAQEALDMIDD